MDHECNGHVAMPHLGGGSGERKFGDFKNQIRDSSCLRIVTYDTKMTLLIPSPQIDTGAWWISPPRINRPTWGEVGNYLSVSEAVRLSAKEICRNCAIYHKNSPFPFSLIFKPTKNTAVIIIMSKFAISHQCCCPWPWPNRSLALQDL